MKRICLISPGHLSTNPRLVKEALALKQAGYDVSVIHGRYSRWGTENDGPIAEEIGKTTAIPFGPAEASRPAYFRQTLLRRGARRLMLASRSMQSVVELAHHPLVWDLTRSAIAEPADLYIAHYVAALPAAAKAAKRNGALFAFDAEDFHLGDLPDIPEHKLEKEIIQKIEGRYLPGAAYVSAASPMIAQAYADTYGIALPTTILNVFPKRNAPPLPSSAGSARPGPSIYWFSQTVGPGRGLEIALRAIAGAGSRPHLYIRGQVTPSYRMHLSSLALQAGVAERLHFLEPTPPDELERSGSAYDLGFVGEIPETQNRTIALTNKIFSYVLSGIPCLASSIPAHRGIAREFGAAMSLFNLDSPSQISGAIDAFLLDSSELQNARTHAWELGQRRFNWDLEQAVFLDAVKRCQFIEDVAK